MPNSSPTKDAPAQIIEEEKSGGGGEQQNQDEDLATQKAKLQPFEQCKKRLLWDRKYGHLSKTNIEEEKQKIETNMKPPRKPLSPYLFFS